MSRSKKTKNIFNSQISNESLFHLEQQTKFKIGQKQVKSGWLEQLPNDEYILNIYSSLKLAQLKQELIKLKDEATLEMRKQQYNQNDGELPSPVKANLFKIAILKKKVLNFQIDNSGDYNKINNLVLTNAQFKISKAPQTDKMIIQKVSGFMNSCYERKCSIVDKILIVQSKKGQVKQNQWIKIDLEKYKMEIQQKTKPLSNKQFQKFVWVNGFTHRILLTQKDNKSYCLYISQQEIQGLFKYLKFYKFQQTLQKNKSQVFSALNSQLYQKVITLFGNKVRIYDHKNKIALNNGQINFNTAGSYESPLNKNSLKVIDMNKNNYSSKTNLNNNSPTNKNGQFIRTNQVEDLPQMEKTFSKKSSDMNDNMSEIFFSPKRKLSQINNISTFKLRSKKATVFYDQLQEDLKLDQIQESVSLSRLNDSPTFSHVNQPQQKIDEFNLNLKDQIGISDVDEESSSHSFVQNRKRTTNISVSGLLMHQINEKNQPTNAAKHQFNINIHEIESDFDQSIYSQDHIQSSRGRRSSSSIHDSPSTKRDPFPPRGNSSSMSSLYLQEIIERQQFQRNQYDPQMISPKSYKSRTSSSNSQQWKFCLHERQLGMHAMCYGLELIQPYHKNDIIFYILQMDPEIQMQKYNVVCCQKQFKFNQKLNQQVKYSHFGNSSSSTFKLNNQSNNFLFALKQQSGNQVSKIRYQRDCSQLVLIKKLKQAKSTKKISPRNISFAKVKEDFNLINNEYKNDYQFYALVKLYISPNPIQNWQQQSTTQFLQKYVKLNIENDYYNYKHNFIDKKRRYHELKLQVNRRNVNKLLKNSNVEQNTFNQIVFYGIPFQMIKKLQKSLLKNGKITRENIWERINFSQALSSKQLKILEDSIVPGTLTSVKMVMKPLQLIKAILNIHSFNQHLKDRLYEVSVFLLARNSFSNVIQNLMTAFAKQVLVKLQSIILSVKIEEQIIILLKIYYQIQYEIDSLFTQVIKYFVQ